MRKLLFLCVFAVAVSVASIAGASEPLKAVVASYLDIQAALAADKMDGVEAAARTIGEHAAKMGADGDAILKASRAVGSAEDIKAARAAFGDLSDAVIARAKAEGWQDLPDAKMAYCPMARKSWLQKDGEIRNPYYGKSMLTCGEFTPR